MSYGLVMGGNGVGSMFAPDLYELLLRKKVPLKVVSVCSGAAAAMMLRNADVSCEQCRALLRAPLENLDAMKELVSKENACLRTPLAVCCADAASGIPVIYYDGLCCDAWNFKIRPLSGNQPTLLEALLCPKKNSPLMDYAPVLGLPVQLPALLGAERSISVLFCGGSTPADIALESVCTLLGAKNDLFFPLNF